MSSEGNETKNTPNPEKTQQLDAHQPPHEGYWSAKFIATNGILLLLALVAGYLEYVAYPALMTGSTPPFGDGFGESNVVLNLSFLTYRFTATNPNCGSSGCTLVGVPAFDFCQGLIYLVILINVAHFIRLKSK